VKCGVAPVTDKLRRIARRALIVALVALPLGALWGFRMLRPLPLTTPLAEQKSLAASLPAPRRTLRAGKLDVTFLVFSDTHLGYQSSERDLLGRVHDPVKDPTGVERINAEAISDMNAIAGKPWPSVLGGTIGAPRGLLVSGDLTNDGDGWQWRHFVAYYGLNGNDGLLRYPVFEGHGNHDKHHSWYVLDRIRERHGGTNYSFDWDDLHLVCLGEAPDDAALVWLSGDLASVGRERPVLVYFHFPLRGPYSLDHWFGRGDYKTRLKRTLAGYNVIALFHGHYHASGFYRWDEWDVYNVGAAKHRHNSFAVVHVDDRLLRVASWQFTDDRWEWWKEKPINGGRAAVVEGGEHAYSSGVVDR
jgi:cytolysin (calcineurin-like family phosphatase)